VVYNRFAPLRSTDGDDGDQDDQDEPFTESHSRRSAKRRRRQTDWQQQQQQGQGQRKHRQLQTRLSSGNTQRRGRVIMTGKSSGHSGDITAAKSIIKKAVFCVDSVRTSCDANDLTRFIRSLNVSVISCFKVNPRRRRDETGPISDRNAFRLCIAASDRDRLLDESKWPESVVISDWYFLNPSIRHWQQQHDGGATGISRIATSSAVIHISTDINAEVQDNTILYQGDGENVMVISNDDHDC